jgi:CYTH domain-containing protein
MSKSKNGGGIENELKYVLDLSGVGRVLESAHKIIEIRQGYLLQGIGNSARIRQSSTSEGTTYEFTFKQKIKPGVCIELDNHLSKEMYQRLVPNAFAWVMKTRVVVDGWDIDIFRDSYGQPYFLMAEIEMPENQEVPKSLIPVVRDFLVYSVTRGDGRFSSRKMGNIKYAKKILRKIRKANFDFV